MDCPQPTNERALDGTQQHTIAGPLQNMVEQLEEGGPEVRIEEIIAFVHGMLPSHLSTLVGEQIVRYRAWNEVYRQAIKTRVKIDQRVAQKNSADSR